MFGESAVWSTTRGKFWAYMLDGLYQSAVVFFMAYLVWTLGLSVSWSGKDMNSLADFGTTVAVSRHFLCEYLCRNEHSLVRHSFVTDNFVTKVCG